LSFRRVAALRLFDSKDETDASHLKEIELMEEIMGGGHLDELFGGN
jgi:hypothetical protein